MSGGDSKQRKDYGSQAESQSAWEGLLQDLYRSGLVGDRLLLIVSDGLAGLAAPIQTVYLRLPHQRCWVHIAGETAFPEGVENPLPSKSR